MSDDTEAKVASYRAAFDKLAAMGHPGQFPEQAVRAALQGRLAEPPPAMPPLTTQAANYARAVAEHAAAGFPRASGETVAARLTICRACDRWVGGRCAECGCPMAIKAQWAEQKCPLGKW